MLEQTLIPRCPCFCGCWRISQTVSSFCQFVLKLISNFLASNQEVLRCHCLCCEAIIERAETKRNILATSNSFKEIIIHENVKSIFNSLALKLLHFGNGWPLLAGLCRQISHYDHPAPILIWHFFGIFLHFFALFFCTLDFIFGSGWPLAGLCRQISHYDHPAPTWRAI